MKTLSRKFGTLALSLSVLLLTAVLIVGCPVSSFEFDTQEADFQPEPGKAYIQLNIEDSFALTILPTTVIGDLLSFELIFTDPVNSSNSFTKQVQRAAINAAIALDNTGTFSFQVIGYIDAAYTNKVGESVARTEVINPGVNTIDPVAIVPTAMVPGTGSGTFSWAINLSGVHSSVAGTVSVLPTGGGAAVRTITISGNTGDSGTHTPITAGYYYVDVNLTTDAATGKASFYQRHALYIYNNMTSHFPLTLTDSNFRIDPYTITFDLNDTGNTGSFTPPAAVKVVPGGTIPLPTAITTSTTYTDGTDTFTFNRWITTDNDTVGGANPTVFTASTAVNASKTAFAIWTSSAAQTGEFDITLTAVTGTPVTPSEETLAWGGSATITVSDSSNFTADGFVWSVAADGGGSVTLTGTGPSITVNTTMAPFDTMPASGGERKYLISVTAITTPGNLPYSGSVNLTVTRP